MKKFKVIASYVTTCEVEIVAKDLDEAYKIAKDLDGGQFETKVDGDDWQIEHVFEVKQ